jgi:hypothetical protein
MNTHTSTLARVLLLVLPMAPMAGDAQDSEASFLSDYSKLQKTVDNPFDEQFIAPDARERAPQYTAVMIDQPELFIHPDSKYKGIKPDDMKVIADALREEVTAELKGAYQIVDKPGPNVLYLRLAVGDLMLQKKKRPILAYIPVGAVVYAVKKLATDVTGKIDLKNMKIEGEALDSVSGEQFAALITSRGSLSVKSAQSGDSAKPLTWDEVHGLFGVIGKRVRCRLDNARQPEEDWKKCGAIGLTAKES